MSCCLTSLRSASLLSGGDETEEGDEEEGCCEEDHSHSAPSSTPDQSQSTAQDQVVAGEEAGKPEEGLSNDIPLSVGEEPVEDDDPNDQSVDSIMADWQEDLEAFKQMENDEL
ncbi:ER degradation-enhancing alpha-mannosidase-like protein 3 isoform X1 [Tachysurus ichikawai]